MNKNIEAGNIAYWDKDKPLEQIEKSREMVVLDLESGCYFFLNDIASKIFEELKEGKSIIGIIKGLVEEYDVDEEVCEEQVTQFIYQLMEKELVAVS